MTKKTTENAMRAETQLRIGHLLIVVVGIILVVSIIVFVVSVARGSDIPVDHAATYRPTILEGAMGVINVLLALMFGALRSRVRELEKGVITTSTCQLKRDGDKKTIESIITASNKTDRHVEEIFRRINAININVAILVEQKKTTNG
jgi:hypothetical protein